MHGTRIIFLTLALGALAACSATDNQGRNSPEPTPGTSTTLGAASGGSPQPGADIVAECRKSHPDADGKPVKQDHTANSQIFVVRGCEAPGLSGVASDGLWEAHFSSYGVDPDYMSPYFVVESFTTDCPALGLDFEFSHMNTVDYRIVVPDETIVDGNSDRPEAVYGLTSVPAAAPQDVKAAAGSALLVFHGSKTSIQKVSCEDLPAVTSRPTPTGQ
jgi:hypothetical protein